MLLDRVSSCGSVCPTPRRRLGADHVRVLEDAASSAVDSVDPRGLAFVKSRLTHVDETDEPVTVSHAASGGALVPAMTLGLTPSEGTTCTLCFASASSPSAVGPDRPSLTVAHCGIDVDGRSNRVLGMTRCSRARSLATLTRSRRSLAPGDYRGGSGAGRYQPTARPSGCCRRRPKAHGQQSRA